MYSLLLLKPDIVAHPVLLKNALSEILRTGIEISGAIRTRLSINEAARLYSAHEGKFFYGRLVRHVSSGTVLALRVRTDPAIRSLLGSSRLWPLPESVSDRTLRQRLALSDVRNVAHNSDPEAAETELEIFDFNHCDDEFLKRIQKGNLDGDA